MGKVVRDREIQTIRKIAITRPFAIAAKIGDRALDFDNHEVARLAEPEDIGAAPVDERKFDEAGIAELVEGAADAPGEKRGCRQGLGGGRG